MTCSCGVMHSFQTPCIHITSILSESTYVTPNMIPIRWWYAYLYYYNSTASNMAPNLAHICKQRLQQYRESQFFADGEFRGIDLTSSGFEFKDLDPVDISSLTRSAIHLLKEFIAKNKVIVKYSQHFNKLWTAKDVTVVQDRLHDYNSTVLNQIDFGGSAVSVAQLSQTCLDKDSDMETNAVSFNVEKSNEGAITANDIKRRYMHVPLIP